MVDNYIEYQIYNDVTGQNEKSTHSSNSGGISTFGAIVSMFAGLFLQSVLYSALGVEVDDVPVLILIVLWIVISFGVACIFDKIGL